MISHMFNSPDAYLNDWYGFATNQAGHVLIIGVGGYILLALLLKLAFWWVEYEEIHHTISIALVGTIYAAWELLQLTAGGTVLDGLADWTFVMGGSVLAYAIWEGMRRLSASVIVAAILAIGAGSIRRRKK